MKPNYQPWEVNIDDFYKISDEKEKLKFLLNFAVLAPSSHNSQPWQFKIENNRIEVFLAEERRLIHSDKNDRQAYISIGCAIENINVAADYFGWETEVLLGAEFSNQVGVINLRLKKDLNKPKSDHLIFSIFNRVTNRNKYSKNLPPVEFISKIESYSNGGVKVFVINDKSKISQMADVALDSAFTSMEDKDFRRELSGYVKNNLTNSGTGIPAFGMGIPTPISFLVPNMVKHLNMSKLSRKDDERLLKEYTPVMVTIATEVNDKKSWIEVGKIYENIALESTKHGISTSVWGAPIQIGDFYKKIQSILSTNFRPQIFFRMGYPTRGCLHSPRLTIDNILLS